MPENPVYSRDDGHFIYLATVELGIKQLYFAGRIRKHAKGKGRYREHVQKKGRSLITPCRIVSFHAKA